MRTEEEQRAAVAAALRAAVAKAGEQERERARAGLAAAVKGAAVIARLYYEALRTEGFTEAQAMMLTGRWVEACARQAPTATSATKPDRLIEP